MSVHQLGSFSTPAVLKLFSPDISHKTDVGGVLTDYCLKIAADWGLKHITAQTTADNPRMISVFEKRGFDIQIDPSSSLVEVNRFIRFK